MPAAIAERAAPAVTMIVVLTDSPAYSANATTRLADRADAWRAWPAQRDEEPTWEDAEWQ